MTVIVQKYGGSSVATPEKIRRIAQLVVDRKKAGNKIVVVVSAMGDSTDELLALAKQISTHPSRRELDMLVSCGERISMALLSMAIADLGEEALSFTGSQSGIITDDNHFAAKIVEVRPYRIEQELQKNKIVIVAGYQGMSHQREVTTLGRGGTDTTAVALAAALGATACEIYSDVPGIFSADPRLVKDAQLLSTISYQEMESLAAAGAQVLNRDAVAFAEQANIKIFARQTGSTSRETVVQAEPSLRPQFSVALRANSHLCTIEFPRLKELIPLLIQHGARLDLMSSNGRDTQLLLDTNNVSSQETLVSMYDKMHMSYVRCDAVSLVGAHLMHSDQPFVSALTECTNAKSVFVGNNRLCVTVSSGTGADLLNCWHRNYGPH